MNFFYLLIIFHFGFLIHCRAQESIGPWLNDIQFSPEKFIVTDRTYNLVPFDSSGFYFSYVSSDENDLMCEGKVFHTGKKSSILIISAKEEDEQCYQYNTTCFQRNSYTGEIQEISIDVIFEDENKYLMNEASSALVMKVIEKYLPEIRNNYLGNEAGFSDVYQEFYDLRIILSGKENELGTTLTVCDYIPTNAVGIDSTDWSIITNAAEINLFRFSRSTSTFIRK